MYIVFAYVIWQRVYSVLGSRAQLVHIVVVDASRSACLCSYELKRSEVQLAFNM